MDWNHESSENIRTWKNRYQSGDIKWLNKCRGNVPVRDGEHRKFRDKEDLYDSLA